jgi:dTDP-4-amino-4,6-dideoxygalactose transaminase
MTSATAELPAIAGGKPIKSTPYTKLPRYGEEEMNELREAIAQQTLFYAGGKKCYELEKQFATLRGCRHAVACSSGTAAIHAATMAVGVSPGDEVIVPPITDMGTILPVMWQGAVPVFCDLDPRTYNMTAESIEKVITPKTRAVIAVHLAGNPCDLRGIKALCDQHKIVLIEDCAQAHGCHYDEKPVGSIGAVGCYSFNEFKHIACGDGGIVITNDDALAKKMRLATDKAYDRSPGVGIRDATFLANNYRMTELQGAVALAQVRKLDSIISRRQSWCGRLTKRLDGLPGLQLPLVQERGAHSYWFYMMRVDKPSLGAGADEFAKAMRAEGVPTSAHYIARPIYRFPLFADHSAFARGGADAHPYGRVDYKKVSCPTAEAILDTCVILAVNEAYSDADLDDTVKAFERVVGYFQSKR